MIPLRHRSLEKRMGYDRTLRMSAAWRYHADFRLRLYLRSMKTFDEAFREVVRVIVDADDPVTIENNRLSVEEVLSVRHFRILLLVVRRAILRAIETSRSSAYGGDDCYQDQLAGNLVMLFLVGLSVGSKMWEQPLSEAILREGFKNA